jgi:hypothetical protein
LIFERLPEHFQHASIKLRQLVEKQHALVCKGNFTRSRQTATTNQTRVADRVVRRTKRTFRNQPGASRQTSH